MRFYLSKISFYSLCSFILSGCAQTICGPDGTDYEHPPWRILACIPSQKRQQVLSEPSVQDPTIPEKNTFPIERIHLQYKNHVLPFLDISLISVASEEGTPCYYFLPGFFHNRVLYKDKNWKFNEPTQAAMSITFLKNGKRQEKRISFYLKEGLKTKLFLDVSLD